MLPEIVIYAIRSVRYYLTASERKQAIVQFFLLLFTSLLDVFGLAVIVPVLLVSTEPGGVQRNHYFGLVYSKLHFDSERTFLVVLIVVLFAFFLLKNLFSVWVNYVQARFTAAIGLTVIRRQLHKYLHFPFWYFSDYGSANLINSTLQVPSTYISNVLRPLFVFLSESIIILVILVAVLVYKPVLLVVLSLVLVPTTLLTYRILRARAHTIGQRLNDLRAKSFSIINDLFSGFVELKLAARTDSFAENLVSNQQQVQQLDAESYLHSLLPVRIIELVAVAGILIIFLYSLFGQSAADGKLVALIAMFAAAAYRLMPSVNRLLMALVQMRQSQYSIENIESFREPLYNEVPPVEQLPLPFHHTLSFDHVFYRFPGQVEGIALQNITLTIRRGEKIGFIGSSGSGKTTLMNILLRFYREQEGFVRVDGEPLTSQHLKAWYQLVGYVKQDTFLMEATIQDNITLGISAEEVDTERLRYSIEQASLSDFIAGLPQGLATPIGERGSKLSGGQRQRIGIARALYKRAEVLLLDEATSALDNETEREVNAAITRLAHTDITILIIAHRLTTLRECDRIYELRSGQVVAEHQYSALVP